MTLEEIRKLVEARSRYPLVHLAESDGAILVVLETQTADGAPAVSSFAMGRAQLDQAVSAASMVERLVDEACGGLARYADSFKPPTWDEVAWGP